MILEDVKDIYCITNLVNGKKYVGQSKNVKLRFNEHCNPNNPAVIGRAINKYGKENFKYEILEHNISNYNERERYWINKLNTMIPYGYNMIPGGEGYPHYQGGETYNSALTNKNANYVKYKLLPDPKYSINDIAKIVGVNPSIIHGINIGHNYRDDKINYPIREKFWIDKVIFELLMTHKCTLEEINDMVYPNMTRIKNINKGKIYHQPDCIYPIIKYDGIKRLEIDLKKESIYLFTKEPALPCSIKIELEFNYDLSINEIAKRHNTTVQIIQEINNGILFFDPNVTYPIRKFDSRYRHLEKEEIEDIIAMLKNPQVMKRDIREKYSISKKTILKIDLGEEGYRIEGIDYPIRGLRKKKIRRDADES